MNPYKAAIAIAAASLVITLSATGWTAPVTPPPAQSATLTQPEPATAPPQFVPCTRVATIYNERPAFRLSDGKTAAIIVPSIGRVMFYGLVGGANQLWNAPPKSATNGGWYNYGGDKTWAAPQDNWLELTGRTWPPYDNWDGTPHKTETLRNGALRTTSQNSPTSGVRCIREYGFDAMGGFVISQVFEKLSGAPVTMSIWSITQVPTPDAVYLRRALDSPYTNGYYGFRSGGKAPLLDVAPVGADLLRLRPTTQGQTKIGLDSPVSGLVALRGGIAFVQRAAKPRGNYPDGASGAGFPVEIYHNPQPAYSELELLSPLQLYKPGNKVRHTVTWHLFKLPDADATSPQAAQFAAEQLQAAQ